MALKFYTDEHIHPSIVSALRRRGVDVLRSQEAGIIYAHQSMPMGKIIQGLLLIYQVLTQEEMENHVEYL